MSHKMFCDKFLNECEFTIHEIGIRSAKKGHRQRSVKDGTQGLKSLRSLSEREVKMYSSYNCLMYRKKAIVIL